MRYPATPRSATVAPIARHSRTAKPTADPGPRTVPHRARRAPRGRARPGVGARVSGDVIRVTHRPWRSASLTAAAAGYPIGGYAAANQYARSVRGRQFRFG